MTMHKVPPNESCGKSQMYKFIELLIEYKAQGSVNLIACISGVFSLRI